MRKVFFLSLLMFLAIHITQADVRLPRIFGDHMVLQRDRTFAVWGWASPQETVTVTFNKQTKTVKAGKDGRWSLMLDAEKSGGPYTLVVKGKNTLTLNDVLVGEVWVCSGQSNMEWTVKNSNNPMEEIAKGNFPNIRHFKVPLTIAASPKDDLNGGEWRVCTPENVGDFTAVGYYFAREISRELNVPVGLINTSWGGTHVETWTSREAFEESDEFRSMIAKMPKLNLDSLAKKATAESRKKIESLQGPITTSKEDIGKWKSPDYNDGKWPTMNIPGLWEQQGLPNVDGVIRFRKTFELSNADLGKDGMLEIGMIDDSDDTYVNGERVGGLQGRYNELRKYVVPANLLKIGTNVIAVRVEDGGGGGGIYGDPKTFQLTVGSKILSLTGDWKFQVENIGGSASGIGPNSYPTLLYNAMVNPLIPYTIKGALWYQGESNAGRAYQYRKAFPLMINDWRKRWGLGDFPFYFVQLATFNSANGDSKKGSTWAELREAQAMTLSLPNTGMAVTTDIGDPKDIHPRNKQDVGKRLAAVALNKTYGKSLVSSGPVYQSLSIDGNKAIVSFTNLGGGLMVKDKYGYVKGFEIAGEDRVFHYAQAEIQGDKIVVYSDSVTKPAAVRYGWADDAGDNNVYNREGFPAAPFRTDQWKGVTEGQSFTF